MTLKNLGLVLHGAKDIRLEERAFADLEALDVRVEFKVGGICGTDMHYYNDGQNAGFEMQSPVCLGHEMVGVVAEIGTKVTRVAVGDHVAVNPIMPCGSCPACKEGRPNICHNKRFPGSATVIPHVDGFFQQFPVVSEENCWKLPKDLPLELAAFAEPLSCALHAVVRAGSVVGKNVLITGAGPIGLLVAACAVVAGAANVIVTDLADGTLEVAKKLGVTETINVLKNPERLEELKANTGFFDVAFEASGAFPALETCYTLTRRGGTVMLVSVLPNKPNELKLNQFMLKEQSLLGSSQFTDEFEKSIALLAGNKIDVRPMLTHQFSFAEADKAFNIAKDRNQSVKVQFVA
ncbi:L-idonate 5-dehydrogenase [Pseudovibrio sp. Tun.PSC04-5.I4]|uniref:L-idonate 5-dehydrogenase n=1 Tax=Pseudovibrio sp. Tun.PSC04-5.I4 TaxID=1798213 RepID=UPI000880593D|nr:L-idonate 5-dehydrogenase [Pseudovibrio sp. Tun.PSC04-5.I4]SDQ74696.1 L-idonate 5-dehydrogenase [Pseudovibrio sp. Tun.PSC04-5.I4]